MAHLKTTPSARMRGEIVRVYGIPIIFGPQRLAVTLVFATLFWFQNSYGAPSGIRFGLAVGSVGIVLLAVECHEFGHGLAAKIYSRKVRSIQVNPCCGAKIFGDSGGGSAKVKLRVALAGPAASFLLSGIASVLVVLHTNFDLVGMLLHDLCYFSALVGLVSLCTGLCIDGGVAVRSIFIGDRVDKRRQVVAPRVAGGTTAFVFAFLAFEFLGRWFTFGPNFWSVIIGAVLVFVVLSASLLVTSTFTKNKTHPSPTR